MQNILDLVRFPLRDLDGPAGAALLARCRSDLARFGFCDLDGLVRPAAVRQALAEVAPLLAGEAAGRVRRHTVYPDPPAGVPAGHPALAEVLSSGRSVAADRRPGGVLARVQHYPPLADFLGRVLDRPRLGAARRGPMLTRYAAGEAAGWHFSRAEVTVTLLLQAAQFGGDFEYVRDLRGAADPNPDGVAELLAGRLQVALERLMPGTLNVFRGRDTAQRVTRVAGDKPLIIAEFAWVEAPAAVASPARRVRKPAV